MAGHDAYLAHVDQRTVTIPQCLTLHAATTLHTYLLPAQVNPCHLAPAPSPSVLPSLPHTSRGGHWLKSQPQSQPPEGERLQPRESRPIRKHLGNIAGLSVFPLQVGSAGVQQDALHVCRQRLLPRSEGQGYKYRGIEGLRPVHGASTSTCIHGQYQPLVYSCKHPPPPTFSTAGMYKQYLILRSSRFDL